MEEGTIAAKACDHANEKPESRLCEYWIAHSSNEFAGVNAARAINCLSPGTHFGRQASISAIAMHFSVGSEEHGSLVDVTLKSDDEVGGMALRIEAHGY
jgi:hypothetical protein